MSSINKATILGRVGKEPEVRYMTNGEAVASFSVATSESWKDKSGNKQEHVEWHNITAFRKLAEIVGEYVKKGDLIYIEGKITTEKWQDKEGNDRYTTKIIANEMKMLGGKRDQESTSQAPAKHAQRPAPKSANFDDFEDDVPF